MSIFLDKRNRVALSERQLTYCVRAWDVLCGENKIILIVNEAGMDGSRTRFIEEMNVVYLGANAYPGEGFSANSRMSVLACLAPELSHAERFSRGYRRPLEMPDLLIDEAETSLNASFHQALGSQDREDLREDARDWITIWLAAQSNLGEVL